MRLFSSRPIVYYISSSASILLSAVCALKMLTLGEKRLGEYGADLASGLHANDLPDGGGLAVSSV